MPWSLHKKLLWDLWKTAGSNTSAASQARFHHWLRPNLQEAFGQSVIPPWPIAQTSARQIRTQQLTSWRTFLQMVQERRTACSATCSGEEDARVNGTVCTYLPNTCEGG